MFADWWLSLDGDAQLAIAASAVSVLVPPLLWLVRKRWPGFDVSSARQKMLAAFAVAFVGGYLATPGDWRQKCLAGVLAVIGSKFAYDTARVATGSEDRRWDRIRRLARQVEREADKEEAALDNEEDA